MINVCSVHAQRGGLVALVRHGLPQVEPAVPPDHWRLSAEGSRAVMEIAMQLRELRPLDVACSPELKAQETARLIYPRREIRLDEDLREHGLGRQAFLSPEAFSGAIENYFRQPHVPVFGSESAHAAARRMQSALRRLRSWPAVVFSHGRIISAYISAAAGVDGLQVWHALKMPDVLLVHPEDYLVCRLDGGERDFRTDPPDGRHGPFAEARLSATFQRPRRPWPDGRK